MWAGVGIFFFGGGVTVLVTQRHQQPPGCCNEEAADTTERLREGAIGEEEGGGCVEGGKGGGEGWEENRQSGGKPHAVAVFERSAKQRPHLSLSPSLWCFGFLFCAPVLTKKRDLAARVFLVIDLQSLFWCGYTWIPMVMVKEKGIPAVMTVCVWGCHECVITGFVLPVVLLTVCRPYRRAVCPFGFKLQCLAEFDLTGLNFWFPIWLFLEI